MAKLYSRRLTVTILFFILSLLVACGGGGGGGSDTSNNTPNPPDDNNNSGAEIVNGSVATGESLYHANIVDTPINGSVALADDGTMYVFTQNGFGLNGFLVALSPNGTTKWAVDTGASFAGSFTTPSIGPDGTIYVGADDLLAIAPDGSVKWQFALVEQGSSPVIGSDGTVYIVDAFGFIYAINPDGTEKWSLNTGVGHNFWSDIAIDASGNLYYGTEADTLIAINSTGSLLWNNDYSLDDPTAPAIGDDGTIYVYFRDGGYVAAIQPDGTGLWTTQINGGTNRGSSVVVDGFGTLYVANGEDPSVINAINPDGTIKWATELSFDVSAAPVVSDVGTVYIADEGGDLWGINPDGSVKWKIIGPLGLATLGSPVIADDGAVYFTTGSGNLEVISTDATGSAGGWPMYLHDAKNTGRAD